MGWRWQTEEVTAPWGNTPGASPAHPCCALGIATPILFSKSFGLEDVARGCVPRPAPGEHPQRAGPMVPATNRDDTGLRHPIGAYDGLQNKKGYRGEPLQPFL